MSGATEAVLVADIGATNARFAIMAGAELVVTQVYPVADYPTPAAAIQAFLAGPALAYPPRRAALAVAGPVVDGRVAMTNAAWVFDRDELRATLGLKAVEVLNDFAAVGWALPDLRPQDLHVVGQSLPSARGTMAALGPGTGFGLTALANGPGGEIVLVTEGGHATLAAENAREDAIIAVLRRHHPHVSIERVLSGAGMVELYQAVIAVDGLNAPERDSPDIVAHALAGDCEASRRTLDAFCAILGSVAGNVALTMGAAGGVFIAGGIAPRFLDFLNRSAFRARFEAKGRFTGYLARIQTAVIVHPHVAFVGLARVLRSQAD